MNRKELIRVVIERAHKEGNLGAAFRIRATLQRARDAAEPDMVPLRQFLQENIDQPQAVRALNARAEKDGILTRYKDKTEFPQIDLNHRDL